MIRTRRGAWSCRCYAFVLVFAVAAGASAQPQRITVDDRVSCPTCVIEVTKVARLGGPRDSIYFFPDATTLVRDRAGRLYVGPRNPIGDVGVTVYSPRGEYLTAFSRRGQGPGEFTSVSLLLMSPQDSLYIIDYGRTMVFSPTHVLARQFPTPDPTMSGNSAVLLPNGGLVLPAMVAGLPLQLLSSQGTVRASFGAAAPIVGREREFDRRRAVASAGDSLVWAAHENSYQVDLFALSGALKRTVVRDVPWFKPWTALFPPNGPPNPALLAVHQDADGLLWTLTVRPGPNAAAAFAPGAKCDLLSCFNDAYDTLIEVIDPNIGQLVAALRIPGYVKGFWSGDLLTSGAVDQDGTPYLDIWQVHLKRR